MGRRAICVETYQFIDNLQHIIEPQTVYDEQELEDLLKEVRIAFEEAGWEGDGQIGLIWIPPFILNNINDTMGYYVWHVKQNNNGISFLGYIESESGQEDIFENNTREITITETNSEFMIEEMGKIRKLLNELNKAKDGSIISDLYYITLEALQNQIIAELVDYIDEVYLQFAEHVIGQNNPDKIKLTKTKVNLPLDRISKGIEDGYMDSWLILKDITSAVWKDFKFWKFSDKLREICHCIDFSCPDDIKRIIIKHVEIRNAIQHHGGKFTSDIAKVIGQNYIVLRNEKDEDIRIELWKKITLSVCEVNVLLDSVERFVDMYERHVKKRMTTREYQYLQI